MVEPNANALSGLSVRQSAPPGAHSDDGGKRTPSQSATRLGEKVLLTFAEAGQLLGIGERKAHDEVPKLVTPVILGPRCVRIVRAELEAAVANLPRRVSPSEPHQLLRGKIERLKRGGAAA